MLKKKSHYNNRILITIFKTQSSNETHVERGLMTLNSKTERLTYILRGRFRCEIYRILLTGNRTIGELSKKTNLLPNTSGVIKQFESYKLVKNLTPSVSKGCIYQLTDIALECKPEFEEHMEFQEGI